MSASNTAWAMQQDFPCQPKFLFVTLTDCAGMFEFYDVPLAKFGKLCGMSEAEVEDAIFALEDFRVLRVVRVRRSAADVIAIAREMAGPS